MQYQLGVEESYMRTCFAAMDVLLEPSMGEGFGVPIIESQAIGTPNRFNHDTIIRDYIR